MGVLRDLVKIMVETACMVLRTWRAIAMSAGCNGCDDDHKAFFSFPDSSKVYKRDTAIPMFAGGQRLSSRHTP